MMMRRGGTATTKTFMAMAVAAVGVLLAGMLVAVGVQGIECDKNETACNLTTQFFNQSECMCQNLTVCVGFKVEEAVAASPTANRTCVTPKTVECVIQHNVRDVALALGVSERVPITVKGRVVDESRVMLRKERDAIFLEYRHTDEAWYLLKHDDKEKLVLMWKGESTTPTDTSEAEILFIDQLLTPPILLDTQTPQPSVSVRCWAPSRASELKGNSLAWALIIPTILGALALLVAGYFLHLEEWHLSPSGIRDVADYAKMLEEEEEEEAFENDDDDDFAQDVAYAQPWDGNGGDRDKDASEETLTTA